MALLEVKNLKTYYMTRSGAVKAVDDVSFNLEKGETLGIAGESGCGKTTACLSIMRMIQQPGKIVGGEILYNSTSKFQLPKTTKQKYKDLGKRILHPTKYQVDKDESSGTIRILDLPVKQIQSIRGNRISMIFQGAMNALNPVHRIGNQILEVIQIHEPGHDKDAAWQRVLDILETVGIDSSRARDYPHQLSGGMQQRALIAMALIGNPDIVIADEPVTALDVIVQSQVLKATKELQKKFNLAMIMVTHDLSVIAEICDSLVIMYAGKICEYGNLRTLYKTPKHPYTEALLSAFPSIRGPKGELVEIPGNLPDLRNPPPGCNFHPRCSKVMDICKVEEPIITPTEDGYVVCHLYQKHGKEK